MFNPQVLAQIIPDSTVETQLIPNVNINGLLSDQIDGGMIQGNNLFHSFSTFHINVGRGVYFTNPADVTNIFTRVTGTSPSNINGTLGVLGSANLFFMNPNGIVFGSNAKLDVKGSFYGTTANSINFADGTVFRASHSQLGALLTVSVPVGLEFGTNPGQITVHGVGHRLTTENPVFLPYFPTGTNSGLESQPERTLALVGAEIHLDGGTLTAPLGQVELGSVEGASLVRLIRAGFDFTLDYAGVQSFRDITLSGRSLVDVSGTEAGSIRFQGRRVSLRDGSVLWVQNRGDKAGGDISVNATESLQVIGTSADAGIRTSVINETVGLGATGKIAISTPQLTIQDGATIASRTFSAAASGHVNVNATEWVKVAGFSTIDPTLFSVIGSFTFSAGNAGNVVVSTKQLSVLEGGAVAVSTFGSGHSGYLTINADTVEVAGFSPGFNPSAIGATTVGSGNAGNLTINTRTLAVRSTGAVATSSLNSGSAGSLSVNASEWIDVSGGISELQLPSAIASAVSKANPVLQRIFNPQEVPNGTSGDVIVNTPTLKVSDGGSVSVSNEGTGKAGTLRVNAKSVQLNNQGSLAALTFSGEGGDIVLRSQNLQLTDTSEITTTAGLVSGAGNGGNITLTTDTIVQLENSNIAANAFQGRGGNIQITTSGLFASPDSSITASSQLGISGVVNLSTAKPSQESALLEQPSKFVSTEQLVATSCLATRNVQAGRFIVTGNGGLPQTPDENLELPYFVMQVRSVKVGELNSSSSSMMSSWKLGDPIVEAKQLLVNKRGHIVLTATGSPEVLLKEPESTCR